MDVGRIFSRGANCGFFQGKPRIFLGRGQNGEISFFQHKTKKTTFFAEKLIQ